MEHVSKAADNIGTNGITLDIDDIKGLTVTFSVSSLLPGLNVFVKKRSFKIHIMSKTSNIR